MSANIKTLKDNNGDQVFPRTRTTAVLDSNDNNLDTLLAQKSSVSVAITGTATDEVQYITIDGVEKKLAGGNVDDVQLNDVSVVDENKIAKLEATEVNTIDLSTAISSVSTNSEIGTAKAVYDAIKSGSVAIGTSAPTDGNIWIDTTTPNSPIFKYKNGNNWIQVSGKLYSDASGTATDGAVTQAGVHNALAGKADTSHTQAASTITAGTLGGQVVANTTAVATLTTGQVRNTFISTAAPTSSDGNNGDIWIKYIN